jgi:hypothetical protein
MSLQPDVTVPRLALINASDRHTRSHLQILDLGYEKARSND